MRHYLYNLKDTSWDVLSQLTEWVTTFLCVVLFFKMPLQSLMDDGFNMWFQNAWENGFMIWLGSFLLMPIYKNIFINVEEIKTTHIKLTIGFLLLAGILCLMSVQGYHHRQTTMETLCLEALGLFLGFKCLAIAHQPPPGLQVVKLS